MRAAAEPAGRIGQERLERELGRSDEGRVYPEAGRSDADQHSRPSQRHPVQLPIERPIDEWIGPGEHAAQHDHAGVQEVDQAGEPDAEPAPHLGERLDRTCLAVSGIREHRLDLLRAAVLGATGEAKQRPLADLGLPAAARSAPALAPVRVDDHVADLAGVSAVARHRPAAGEQAAADTGVALGTGVLTARPAHGVTALLLDPYGSGGMLRRLLPAAIGIPWGLGWLCLWGQRAGWYDPTFGVALFAVSTMVLLATAIWRNARTLEGIERQR